MRHRFFVLLFSALVTAGCAKEKLQIGREDPEKEIQKCLELSQKKRYKEAVECLEIFKSRFQQTPQGQEAELRIADNYFNQKEYLLAADTYQTFLKLYPFHPQADYASYRTGLSYLKEFPGEIDRDTQYLKAAVGHLQAMLQNHPNSIYREAALSDLKAAREKLAKRHFYIARFYFRTGEYIAAIPRFEEILEIYADSPLTPRALYLKMLAHERLGQDKEASLARTRLKGDFAESPWAKKVKGH